MRKRPIGLLVAAATALVIGSAAPASAEFVSVGSFGWTMDAFGVPTLGVDIFADFPDFPGWPIDLVIRDVYARFTRQDGAEGQAFFGYLHDSSGGCAGETATLDASTTSLQIPGINPTTAFDCSPADPLPDDVLRAELMFSFDASIGAVSVGELDGPPDPFGPAQPIMFERATTSVPEPTTAVLFGAGLMGLGVPRFRLLRARRTRSSTHRPT